MEKDRELQGESGNIGSRREFLHQVAGTSLVVAATGLPHVSFAQAVPRPRSGRRPRQTADDRQLAGVFQVVCALPLLDTTKDPPQIKSRLALHADLTDPKKPKLTLNLADETPTDNQKFEFYTDGSIHSVADKTGGYLAIKGNDLTLDSTYVSNYWWLGHIGDHAFILAQPANANPMYYILNGALDDKGKAPGPVKHGGLVYPHTGHFWKFNPTTGGPGGGGENARALQYHVLDACDSTWHNPACPGNPATWTGCSYNTAMMKCQCQHA